MRLIRVGTDPSGNPIFDIAAQTLIVAIVPQELKGSPGGRAYTSEEVSRAIIEDDMTFDTIREGWSVYELVNDGGQLQVKLVLAKVSRTSLYDLRGDPIYAVNTQPILKPVPIKRT